jgi:hypothetical protein
MTESDERIEKEQLVARIKPRSLAFLDGSNLAGKVFHELRAPT